MLAGPPNREPVADEAGGEPNKLALTGNEGVFVADPNSPEPDAADGVPPNRDGVDEAPVGVEVPPNIFCCVWPDGVPNRPGCD